jgi:hypothetical protein
MDFVAGTSMGILLDLIRRWKLSLVGGGQALGDSHLTLLRASYHCAYISVEKCGVRSQEKTKKVMK